MSALVSFAEKVQEVRRLQKDYFIHRDRDILAKCKREEAKLDQAIEDILRNKDRFQPKNKDTQTSLL